MHAKLFAAALLLGETATLSGRPASPLPLASPESAGVSAERLARLDGAVGEALRQKLMPGAVVLVGHRGKVVYRKAFGMRSVAPVTEPMTLDTVFDLASLTKVVATATSVMTLVERGALRLSDPVVRHIPEFGTGGGAREQVTVEQLLTHRAGLPPDDPMELYDGPPAAIFARKYRQSLAHAPGARFVYSDVGYEVLGELVRRVDGRALDRYAADQVFGPLGMEETEFRPLGKPARLPLDRVAPTERVGGRILRGEVHDPRARALGGVAGHAGLFSTGDDLARFCLALLGGGGGVLSPAGVSAMTAVRYQGDGDLRALGWDVATAYSSPRGDLFPTGSFGHTGWTGTSLWIDPTTDTFVVLLSNRVHPDESGNVVALRSKVATLAAAALTDVPVAVLTAATERVAILTAAAERAAGAPRASRPGASPGDVLPGIDVLSAGGFREVAGKRIGLVTNQTGLARDGRSTIDVLVSGAARAAGVRLVRLFSPEHGIRGTLDEKVADSRDERTGLPVRSLYGETRRPRPEDLSDLEAVVVDLQDVGCRFYTYLTTLGYVMEGAALSHVPVVVLDRPNPTGATRVEGPLADEERLSFTAYHTIPVRPAMTFGELATLFNAERRIGADLLVVRMKGYRRELWYDETGLAWVNTSPNLRSVTQAALYPGVALLETTNVSVGRGTEAPFEQVGAPWLDAVPMARTLNARDLPGVRFVPVSFTPQASAYKGQRCAGVRIDVVDRGALEPVRLGLEIATALRDRHPKDWDGTRFGELLASGPAWTRFQRGETASQIAAAWAAGTMDFERRRAAYLLY